MEHPPLKIFQDKEFCKNELEGWKHEGLYILRADFILTIYDQENKILWNGKLEPIRKCFLSLKKTYPDHWDYSPNDVDFETWKKWFKQKPPYRAKLIIES